MEQVANAMLFLNSPSLGEHQPRQVLVPELPLLVLPLGKIYTMSGVWFYHSSFPFETGSLCEPGASWLPVSPVSTLHSAGVPGM